jgi:transcriptional regulator with XRE-family HTH domain
MFGQKVKELREAKGLVQRQVAAELEVDTAYISKIENEEKTISRSQIPKLSKLFKVSENDLETIWLSDKIMNVLNDEKNSLSVITLTLNRIKNNEINK